MSDLGPKDSHDSDPGIETSPPTKTGFTSNASAAPSEGLSLQDSEPPPPTNKPPKTGFPGRGK